MFSVCHDLEEEAGFSHYDLFPPSDPDGFHLDIVAEVAELYLGLTGIKTDGGEVELPSELCAAFKTKGLDEPDFALFQDFAR